MKKSTLFLLAAMVAFGANAETLLIGGGVPSTPNKYLNCEYNAPINTLNKYSYSETVFTASEVSDMVGQEISSISFAYFFTPTATGTVKVYMANSDETAPVNTTDPTGLTLVAESEVTIHTDDSDSFRWLDIPLTTKFTLEEGKNLLLYIQYNTTSAAYVQTMFAKSTGSERTWTYGYGSSTTFLYSETTTSSDIITKFTYGEESSAIESVEKDCNIPIEMYDLNGRKVSDNTANGLYIIKQGNKTKKVIVNNK